MRILIVSHGIPTLNDPQYGCFELDQARALHNLGHEVAMMSVDGRYRRYSRKVGVTESVVSGISCFSIYYFPYKLLAFDSLKRRLRISMASRLFRYVARKWNMPDMIYAHYLFGMHEMAGVHKSYPRIPIVGIEHWSKLNQPQLPSWLRVRGEIAYRTVDRLLAVSESLQRQIEYHFGLKSDVVYDMLGEEFVVSKPRPKQCGSSLRFVSVGSLISIKAFDLLIRAFDECGLKDECCTLAIVGDGEEHSNLQKLIDDRGLSGYVRLLGRKNKQEIISILRDSDAFVLVSHAETFGVVYIEAMSQGLPVIATACGGPEEFVNDSNGILIKPSSLDAVKDALLKMRAEIGRYDNVMIAKDISARFAPQVIAKQLDVIFKEVVEKKKAGLR